MGLRLGAYGPSIWLHVEGVGEGTGYAGNLYEGGGFDDLAKAFRVWAEGFVTILARVRPTPKPY